MADVTPVGECVHKQAQDGDGDGDVVQCMYLVEGGSLKGEQEEGRGGVEKGRTVAYDQ